MAAQAEMAAQSLVHHLGDVLLSWTGSMLYAMHPSDTHTRLLWAFLLKLVAQR